MGLESSIAIKLLDKLRHNKDVKYTFKLMQIDVFEMVGNILSYRKEYVAVDKFYEVSSGTDHHGH
jgi:hypothetical protein